MRPDRRIPGTVSARRVYRAGRLYRAGHCRPRLLASGLLLAVVLYFEKSGDVFFALAAQTVFLKIEIVELALVDQQCLGIDEVRANGLVFVCKSSANSSWPTSIDAHFERRDAQETPLRIGERLNESLLLIANGFVLFMNLAMCCS